MFWFSVLLCYVLVIKNVYVKISKRDLGVVN